MSRNRRLVSALAISALMAATGLASMTDTLAGPSTSPTDANVSNAFDELQAYVASLQSQLGKGPTQSFLSKLGNAESKYNEGQVCVSYNELGAFDNQAKGSRGGAKDADRAALLEDLFNRGHALRSMLFDVFIDNPNLMPPACFDPQDRAPATVAPLASDNTLFSAEIAWPEPRLWTSMGGGQTWTQMSAPGLQAEVGPAGLPAVPTWQSLLAIPHGARAELHFPEPPAVGETLLLNLAPFQDAAADGASSVKDTENFEDPPFVVDTEAYEMDAFWPPDPCHFGVLGQTRDVIVGQVSCALGQYNPATDQFMLFDSTAFEVTFTDGNGQFITEQSLSGFEPASEQTIQSVLNANVVSNYVLDIDWSRFLCFGNELLILTHPDFREAADDLAAWKETKGLSTSVIEVGAGTAYTTGPQIDDLVEGELSACAIRPSYIDIIGDSEFVPPARLNHNTLADCAGCGDSSTGSDWEYATTAGNTLLPTYAVGRITADSLEEAQMVVDKIIQYESDPPFINFGAGGPYYTTVAAGAYHQCCRNDVGASGWDKRGFVETTEWIRDEMLDLGYDMERIYTKAAGTTPRKYYNGVALPAELSPEAGYPWDGSTADVVAAFNEGRFIIYHRDHAGWDGWSHPDLELADLAGIDNGEKLPVVFSINCSSGYWDRETDGGGPDASIMERLLVRSDGMVSGIGDNRDSNTWLNNVVAKGLFDAAFPSVVPFGGATPKQRLGDMMNHAKRYLVNQIDVVQTAGSISMAEVEAHQVLYHLLGDATLEMWTGNPHAFELPLEYEVFVQEQGFVLEYAVEGASITAFEEIKGALVPFGRGMAQNQRVPISSFTGEPRPVSEESLVLVATFPNAVSVLLTPRGKPDLIVEGLFLLDSNNVTQGEDLTERLMMRIGNIGTAKAFGTIRPDGTINDAGYMVDIVLSRDTFVPPGFRPLPLPAGEAFEEDGLLQGARVSRTPDLAPGEFHAYPTPLVGGVIPTQAPPTKMHLCASIDSPLNTDELDETNNVTCIEVNVLSPGPE